MRTCTSDGNQHKQPDPVSTSASERCLCSHIPYLKTSQPEAALCQTVFFNDFYLAGHWKVKEWWDFISSVIFHQILTFPYSGTCIQVFLGMLLLCFHFLLSYRCSKFLSHNKPSFLVQTFPVLCEYQVSWWRPNISSLLVGVSRGTYFHLKIERQQLYQLPCTYCLVKINHGFLRLS